MSVEIFLLLAAVVVGLGLLVRRQDAHGAKEQAKKSIAAPTIQGPRAAAYMGSTDDPMMPPRSAARAFSDGAAKFTGSATTVGAAAVAGAAAPAATAREHGGADADTQRSSGDGAAEQGDGG